MFKQCDANNQQKYANDLPASLFFTHQERRKYAPEIRSANKVCGLCLSVVPQEKKGSGGNIDQLNMGQ